MDQLPIKIVGGDFSWAVSVDASNGLKTLYLKSRKARHVDENESRRACRRMS